MNVYKEWLQNNGVKFEEEEFGLVFRYQGSNFIIFNPKNDELFFQLVMPGIYEVQPGEKMKVLEIANTLTRDVKCLKVVVQDGGSVWLMTEIFIDKTPDIDDFMERLLDILHEGRYHFYSKMQ
ncbi:MAG: hypothetical protein IKS94_02415 [Prevotella sp.]|nr:hypothetical protein [Prevotella sp.]